MILDNYLQLKIVQNIIITNIYCSHYVNLFKVK